MNKKVIAVPLFLAAFIGGTYLSVQQFGNYTSYGFNKFSTYVSSAYQEKVKKDKEQEEKEAKEKQQYDEEQKSKGIALEDDNQKRNEYLYYQNYIDPEKRQEVDDYINFFNRAIKKHPEELKVQKIAFIGSRPLLGDVFYHTVNDKVYRVSNFYNEYDGLLITDRGENYVFKSNTCSLNYKTKEVNIIKTEAPGNKIAYFMLPKNERGGVSYIPDCTLLKLLKVEE